MDIIEILRGLITPELNPLTRNAIEQSIKALENQPKYEAALDMICNDYFDDMSRCPSGITVCKDEGLTCGRCIIEHYKKKAGLEVSP